MAFSPKPRKTEAAIATGPAQRRGPHEPHLDVVAAGGEIGVDLREGPEGDALEERRGHAARHEAHVHGESLGAPRSRPSIPWPT